MPQTSRPGWTAATLAAVRQQLLDAAAFGTTLPLTDVDGIVARLDRLLRGQFRAHSPRALSQSRRSLHPRSPMGCQGYRQGLR
ncbi:DUF6374 family protein [Nocardia sp. NPDC058497]|uniref:DUF6374 family protein n=1 Tax=Nocardia sp. NPDC058497 TaxID=3346529 RepID=UPI00364BADFF